MKVSYVHINIPTLYTICPTTHKSTPQMSNAEKSRKFFTKKLHMHPHYAASDSYSTRIHTMCLIFRQIRTPTPARLICKCCNTCKSLIRMLMNSRKIILLQIILFCCRCGYISQTYNNVNESVHTNVMPTTSGVYTVCTVQHRCSPIS
jgi:hypothetical protein